ncbi:MAG: MBG domain-containing protein, partial [Bacteroidota bacterium]
LLIAPRPISILADSKSKVYGSADPLLTWRITSGNLVGTDQVSGSLVRASGQSVGTYAINQGSLTAGSNYLLTFSGALLTITPASLTVKANDVTIYAGQTPVYSSTIAGFVNGDTRSGVVSGEPTYTVSGDIRQPGTYTITPSALPLYQPTNYTVGNYLTGTLTVNIDPSTMSAIRPVLRCVEVLNNDPDGFKYLARFEYINNNTVTVFIPIGPDNFLNASGKFKALDQPEYFKPGGGAFNVKFNGEKLIWTVTSMDKTKKTAVATEASSNSTRCKKGNGRDSGETTPAVKLNRELSAHPNPATDFIRISFPSDTEMNTIKAEDLRLLDQTGRSTEVPVQLLEAENAAELDVRNLTAGMYMVRIRTENGYRTIRVIKAR